MSTVPASRVLALNAAPERAGGAYVLYWMTAARRTEDNFALERAAEHARRLARPLVVFEPLRVGYRWASARHPRFVLPGMLQNRAALAGRPATYLPYVEPAPGAGRGLLAALAARAAVVVTDDFPCFFLPRMAAAAARALDVRLEAVDGNGLYPMRLAGRTFARAFDFRRHLQRELGPHLLEGPAPDPLAEPGIPALADLPGEVLQRWPAPSEALLRAAPEALAALPIDPAVGPAAMDGGAAAAQARWAAFLADGLDRYGEDRSHPDRDGGSKLSPWLHFGHVSVHRLFRDLAAREGWRPHHLGAGTSGAKEGWWGVSPPVEAFLDELVTWRELGFNLCSQGEGYDRLEGLPGWAQATMAEHAADPRPHLYDLATLEAAQTHDEVWNAAQRELVREGRMHNYLRMLWGKKIYEWSPSGRAALDVMIHLNNRYAVDGRDPNSYSGIFWVLGRYDRAWGPERPIFGKLRYMSSENTKRKLHLTRYLERYGLQPGLL